jgi:hypothetical protein
MSEYITVPTYTATIYVGFKERSSGELVFSLEAVSTWLQEYVNDVGLCVSVMPTEFIYTNGGEPGAAIGLINYPRFPSYPDDIRERALEIAAGLKAQARQLAVTVVFPYETVMLSTHPEEGSI